MHITYERKGVSFIERGRKRVPKTDGRRNVEIIEEKILVRKRNIVLDLDYAYVRQVGAKVLFALCSK